jgi:outer membrane usher protein
LAQRRAQLLASALSVGLCICPVTVGGAGRVDANTPSTTDPAQSLAPAPSQASGLGKPVQLAELAPDLQNRVQLASLTPQALAAMTPAQIALLLQSDPIGTVPKAQPKAKAGDQAMILIATVNGTRTDELLTITRTADGGFVGKAGELRSIRIKVDPLLSQEDPVPLADLAGVTFKYDEANQAIALQVPDKLLETYQVELGGARHVSDLNAVKPSPGAVLNYGLYATHSGGYTQYSANAEGLAMTRFGIFSATGLYNSVSSFGGRHFVRLDSSWRLVDPKAIRSYTIGDFASNALSWSNSVRLGGFQISSAFDQRPDLVTTALPQFSGSAALPSTLDLYVNQQKVFSGEIPSGPFDMKSLPYVSGGDVKLVTTDATGKQVSMEKSFYYVSSQLKPGLLQYSLDVGAPRLDYGIDSAKYDHVIFGSGSVRYGVNGKITIEGHGETSSDGLINGGGGVVTSIGGIGAISASFAGSHYKGRNGGRGSVDVEGQYAGVHLFAGTERSIGSYIDLSRLSILRTARRDAEDPDTSNLSTLLTSTAQANKIDRAGLSFTPWFDKTSVSLSYSRLTSPTSNQRIGSLSLSRTLGNRISLYTNGYLDLDKSGTYGVYATLNVQLGGSINLTAGASHDDGRTGYSLQASGATGMRQGDIGWGITDQEYQGGDAQRSAYVGWRGPLAQLRAQVDQSSGEWRESLQAEGSFVVAGGGVFAADRIGNSFAIVKNAGPKVEILQGGVRMGKTNKAGSLLLPDLTPYYEQHIYLDPADLPDGWEPNATEHVAIAAYRQGTIIDFGAKIVHSAVLVLNGKDGKPIQPGYTVQLEGGESGLVGYDGQVYLRGLNASNRVSVDLGPGGVCTVTFPYDLKGPAQPQIGPLTCR